MWNSSLEIKCYYRLPRYLAGFGWQVLDDITKLKSNHLCILKEIFFSQFVVQLSCVTVILLSFCEISLDDGSSVLFAVALMVDFSHRFFFLHCNLFVCGFTKDFPLPPFPLFSSFSLHCTLTHYRSSVFTAFPTVISSYQNLFILKSKWYSTPRKMVSSEMKYVLLKHTKCMHFLLWLCFCTCANVKLQETLYMNE